MLKIYLRGIKDSSRCRTPHLEIIAGEQSYKVSHSITILNDFETGNDSPDKRVTFDPSSRIAFKHSNHL